MNFNALYMQLSKRMAPMPLVITVVLAMNATMAIAQNSEDYDALRYTLGAEKYALLSERKQELHHFMAYRNKHGYHLSLRGEKVLDMMPLGHILPAYDHLPQVTEEMLSSGDWNMEGYLIPGNEKDYRYFEIPASSHVLVILPIELVKIKQLQSRK